MCSPSRATFLTGRYPSRHGVTLTMTAGDLFPDRRNVPDVLRTVAHLAATGEVPRDRLARRFVRGLLQLGPKSGNEPELPAGFDTLGKLLRERGYHVAFKGKWHLSKPVNGRDWSAADSERIERDYGFAEWEPPDAGGDAKAETFGGGNAGTTHEGWDEDYIRQVEAWLGARADSRAVLPRRLAREPPRRARLPVLVRAGRLQARGLPRPRSAAAADGRRGPAREADCALADEARADGLHRRARRRPGPARLRQLLRLPARGGGQEDRPAARQPRGPGRPRVAAGAHGDRADLRSRRAGSLARRAAAEDVQRVRGVDPRPARDLESRPLPPVARERRPRLARRPRADAPGPDRGSARSGTIRWARPGPAAPRRARRGARRGALHL